MERIGMHDGVPPEMRASGMKGYLQCSRAQNTYSPEVDCAAELAHRRVWVVVLEGGRAIARSN